MPAVKPVDDEATVIPFPSFSPSDVFSDRSTLKTQLLGSVHDWQFLAPDEVLPFFTDHLNEFITAWNENARDKGYTTLLLEDLIADEDRLMDRLGAAANSHIVKQLVFAILEGKAASQPGYANFAEKIDYIQRILMRIQDPTWRSAQTYSTAADDAVLHVNFEAETQWGKTIVMVMSWLLALAHMDRATAAEEMPIILNVVRVNPANATKTDLEGAAVIYGTLKFVNAKQNLSTAYTMHEHRIRRIRVNDDGKPGKSMVKKSGRDLDDLDVMFENFVALGVKRVPFWIDEADEATKIGSVVSRMLDLGKKHGILVRLILFSATSYPYQYLDRFDNITVTFDKESGYSGTFQGKPTPILGLSAAERAWGIRRLSWFKPALMDDASRYGKIQLMASGGTATSKTGESILTTMLGAKATFDENGKKVEGLPKNHTDYFKACCGALGETIQSLVTNTKPDGSPMSPYGPIMGGKVIMARIGTRSLTGKVAKELEPLITALGGKVIEFWSDSDDAKVIKLNPDDRRTGLEVAIDKAFADDAKFVIVAVAGVGRRADRFPRTTTVFFDFTENFSTVTAAEQGTLGRASGWGKITDNQTTTVILSDRNANLMAASRYLFGKFQKKIPLRQAGSYSVRIDTDIDVVTEETDVWTLDTVRLKHPALQDIRDEIDRIVGGCMFTEFDDDGALVSMGLAPLTDDDAEGGYVIFGDNHQPCGNDEADYFIRRDDKGNPHYYFPIFDLLDTAALDTLQDYYASEGDEPLCMGMLRVQRPEDATTIPPYDTHHADRNFVRTSVKTFRGDSPVVMGQVHLTRDMDPALKPFFDEVQQMVDDGNFVVNVVKVPFETQRVVAGKQRTLPLLGLLSKHNLHNWLAASDLFDGARIARPGATDIIDVKTGKTVDYVLGADNESVEFTFSARNRMTGLVGRGSGPHDGHTRDRLGARVQITMKKLDPATLEPDNSGEWRVWGVAYPREGAVVNATSNSKRATNYLFVEFDKFIGNPVIQEARRKLHAMMDTDNLYVHKTGFKTRKNMQIKQRKNGYDLASVLTPTVLAEIKRELAVHYKIITDFDIMPTTGKIAQGRGEGLGYRSESKGKVNISVGDANRDPLKPSRRNRGSYVEEEFLFDVPHMEDGTRLGAARLMGMTVTLTNVVTPVAEDDEDAPGYFNIPTLTFTYDGTKPRVRLIELPLSEKVMFFDDNIKNIAKYAGTLPAANSLFNPMATAADFAKAQNGGCTTK